MVSPIKIANDLKSFSDEQLRREMTSPSGVAPQYLVLTELQRRKNMDRDGPSKYPEKSMAEEASAPPDAAMMDAIMSGIGRLPPAGMRGAEMQSAALQRPVEYDGRDVAAMAGGGPVRFQDGGYNFSPEFLSRIRGFEGYRSRAYPDYKQHSIGYGTRASSPDEVIDRAEAERRLVSELGKARASVMGVVPEGAPPGAVDALTSLTYNAGPKWASSGLGDLVRAGKWDEARERMQQYNLAGGDVHPGLVKRRAEEGSWFNQSGEAGPQTADVARGGEATAPAPAADPSRDAISDLLAKERQSKEDRGDLALFALAQQFGPSTTRVAPPAPAQTIRRDDDDVGPEEYTEALRRERERKIAALTSSSQYMAVGGRVANRPGARSEAFFSAPLKENARLAKKRDEEIAFLHRPPTGIKSLMASGGPVKYQDAGPVLEQLTPAERIRIANENAARARLTAEERAAEAAGLDFAEAQRKKLVGDDETGDNVKPYLGPVKMYPSGTGLPPALTPPPQVGGTWAQLPGDIPGGVSDQQLFEQEALARAAMAASPVAAPAAPPKSAMDEYISSLRADRSEAEAERRANRDKTAQQREYDQGLGLMRMAGEIMAGTSPHALVNVGGGLTRGLRDMQTTQAASRVGELADAKSYRDYRRLLAQEELGIRKMSDAEKAASRKELSDLMASLNKDIGSGRSEITRLRDSIKRLDLGSATEADKASEREELRRQIQLLMHNEETLSRLRGHPIPTLNAPTGTGVSWKRV